MKNKLPLEFVEACQDDLKEVQNFLQPYMDRNELLQRTSIEMELLLKHAFLCRIYTKLVGFAALEIYSKKLAEIQCLAVESAFRRQGIGGKLVKQCVDRARTEKVKELMAISASEDMFFACGFEYSLPQQKRAFFIEP